jgi:hypothetical protein
MVFDFILIRGMHRSTVSAAIPIEVEKLSVASMYY